MDNVWQQAPKTRLKLWRDFRLQLDSVDYEEDCLQAVVDWWKSAPVGSRELDIYDVESWPDPWQLVYNNALDENSIALGIAYTLHLIDWECEVLLVQNQEESWIRLIVLVDDKYVLNYTYGKVEETSVLNNCQIVEKYFTNQLTK
tara:strand:+ start:9674 stop:10108 length:435 start_codon:yes stop_codon:yes gene_type:complete